MKWEDVLKRNDIVGGDLEAHEDGNIYRGPIKNIELKNGMVDIQLDWCAMMPKSGNPNLGQWKAHHITIASVDAEVLPREGGGSRVTVVVPGLGMWFIFPKGDSKLDPAKVAGLKLT